MLELKIQQCHDQPDAVGWAGVEERLPPQNVADFPKECVSPAHFPFLAMGASVVAQIRKGSIVLASGDWDPTALPAGGYLHFLTR